MNGAGRVKAVAASGYAVVLLAFGASGCGGSDDAGGEAANSIPEGSVAVIDVADIEITQEQLDDATVQAVAALSGGQEVDPASPEYEMFAQAALDRLLIDRWINAEAEERGIEVTEAEVTEEIENVKAGFDGTRKFVMAIKGGGFCTDTEREDKTPVDKCSGVLSQGRLIILQRKLAAEFETEGPERSEEIQQEFVDKWTERTSCLEEIRTASCSGFEAPPIPEQIPGEAVPPGQGNVPTQPPAGGPPGTPPPAQPAPGTPPPAQPAPSQPPSGQTGPGGPQGQGQQSPQP